jgi:hypothetical protein
VTDLLDQVLQAHGGRERWHAFRTVTAHQTDGGVLWGLKQSDGVDNDASVTVRLHEQWASLSPFTGADRHSVFTADRVAIEDANGNVVEELDDPRETFAGHTLETPWSRLQLAYFAGYAMWTYLTEPFSLTLPGVRTDEIEPWSENGEIWRRLKVTYPTTIATHSAEQILYVDADGLLRRRDYEVDIAGGSPAAHYMSGHREISGVIIPTTRLVHIRDEDGHPMPEPIVVSIELDDIRLS